MRLPDKHLHTWREAALQMHRLTDAITDMCNTPVKGPEQEKRREDLMVLHPLMIMACERIATMVAEDVIDREQMLL